MKFFVWSFLALFTSLYTSTIISHEYNPSNMSLLDRSTSTTSVSDPHLILLRPTFSYFIATYSTMIDLQISFSLHDKNFIEKILSLSFYQICILFSDQRFHCHLVQKLSYSYHISFDHKQNQTVIEIFLCSNECNSAERCKMEALSALNLVAYAPQMDITEEIWRLLLSSSDLYHKIRFGVLFGAVYPDDLKRLIGVSNELRILTTDTLDYCQGNIAARVIHCCNVYKPVLSCLPPVLDVGIFVFNHQFIASFINKTILENFLTTLKFVNGRALFLSPDLSFFEILDIFPPSILPFIEFEHFDHPIVALRSVYRTVVLVDLTQLWIPSIPSLLSSNTLPSSTISVNLSYGFDTMTLTNICLVNQTSILFRSSPGKNLSPELLNLINTRFPDWNFYENFEEMSMNISWISHTTLAAAPPYTYSISHLLQTILPLIHYLHYPSHYSWIQELKERFYFLFPTIYRDDYEWSYQLLSLIRNFFIHHLSTQEPQFLFRQDLKKIQQYPFKNPFTFNLKLKEHHMKPQFNLSNVTGVCFEKLILLAPVQISTPFLNDNLEARALRQFTYDWIEGSIQTGSYFDSSKHELSDTSDQQQQNHHHHSLTPNHALRVTLVSRPHNRRILNLHEVIHIIASSGIADMDWFMSKGGGSTGGIYLEIYSFTQQVQLMKETDILICTHGSGTSNWIFLQEYSGVIEILTSPWYQMIAGTPIMMNIFHYNLFQTNRSALLNCENYQQCLEIIPVLDRGRCISLRQCDTWIDLEAFEMLLNQISHQVRIMKRKISKRRFFTSMNAITMDDPEDILQHKVQQESYREGRRIPLDEISV